MRPQTVLIPVRRFEVEVVLGPHDGLSILEQYLLRAVALGAGTVETLSDTLGIPARMVLEAVIDLLGRGLVDARSNGALQVHDRVRDAMGDPQRPTKDWFVDFQSANLPEPKTVHLMQDLVAGEVFSLRSVPRLERARLPMMPENAAVAAVDDIPLATLLAAVSHAMRAVRRMDASGDLLGEPLPRDARILNVKVRRGAPPNSGAGQVAVRSMRIEAQVMVTARGADEPPRVVVIEPASLPAHVRRNIGSALDSLWVAKFGRGQFFDRIEAFAKESTPPPPPPGGSPTAALLELEKLVADDKRTPPEMHHDLVAVEAEARDAIEHLAAHAAEAQLLVGTAATFHSAALEALKNAEQQVLLACPWIGQLARSEEWQEALSGALARGVNVVLVWGIDEVARLSDDPAWRAVARLETGSRGTGALVAAHRGARSHTKLVVRDIDSAVITSCNFLNSSPDRAVREVGVRVDAGSDGPIPLAIQSALTWARRLVPDYLLRERCLDTPLLFGRREARPLLRVEGEPVLPPQLEFGGMGRDLWRGAWQARCDELRETARVAQRAIVPVFDGEHRELFVRAIEAAGRRLLVESHRVSTYGLSEPVVEALLAAVGRGVEVKLRYGSSDLEPLAAQRLGQLADAGVDITPMETHAKLLVCDDWAVISSYNFLSVDPGTRSAHELGMQIFTPTLVDPIWAAVGQS